MVKIFKYVLILGSLIVNDIIMLKKNVFPLGIVPVLMLALALGFGLVSPAFASSSIVITSPTSSSGCQLSTTLTVTGSAVADAPPGQLQQYAVSVDWGDTSTSVALPAGTFGSGHGTSSSTPFSVSHTYTTPGTYTISAMVFHQSSSGNDNPDAITNPITVCIVAPLEISKTVNTSYDRNWNWSIDKTAATSSILLSDGQLYGVNYNVSVNASSTDSNHMATGTISVTNPVGNPSVSLTGVTDTLSIDGVATVTCPGSFPQSLAAGATLTCTYTKSLGTTTAQTNQAMVTASDSILNASTSVAVTLGAPTVEINECVTVTDTATSTLGTACAGVDTLPKTFSYTLDLGKNILADVPLVCGANTYNNTATFTTNDTAATGTDSASVSANVACVQGCTLTKGYWKTHNETFKGGAPADDNWFNLSSLGENTLFNFSTGSSTWFTTLWTSPSGGNVWYQLAHQWMAAKLNALNGAATPAPVATAITSAQTWLASHSPSQNLKAKDNADAKAWASTLGSYNEGNAGVPHCSEDTTSQQ
jgi:hypothetical protein